MPIQIHNTRTLIQPGAFKWKLLIVGRPGVGKTTFLATVPNIGIAAVETGHGDGLLSVASKGVDYILPDCMTDLDALASGHVFKDKEAIGLDSSSAVVRTIIKDYALKIPRRGGNSPKREAGVPELDDYGVMGEIARRIFTALINLDKHVVITALEKSEKDENGAVISCGPDLPGQMYLAAPAMFDTVLYLKTRKAFRDPRDAKTAYTQHYFVTRNDGFHVGKDRNNAAGKAILAPEEIFDPQAGVGTFPALYAKIAAAYQELK